jgi:hypothetical protein
MVRTKSSSQAKTVDIMRGLFVVRYAAADDEFYPPTVKIALDSGTENAEFVLHPDASEPVLWKPGTALVVRAAAPGRLQIEVAASREGGSLAANVKVEHLAQGVPPDAHVISGAGAGLSGLRILGHVAGIGDVMVGPNQWIAGPTSPSRIEGIAIQWPNKPHDIDLRYAVRIARSQTAPSRMMEIGTYAGTRGQAMPLTGAIFELSGSGSVNHHISAEAAFLGSPTMRVLGKRVVLSGPTSREPLVGLRLSLETITGGAGEARQAAAVHAEPPAAKATPKRSGRVRVFRSRSKEGQAS